jgi:hypothetical protein
MPGKDRAAYLHGLSSGDFIPALLAVLTGCTSIERAQQDLLDRVCDAPTITVGELTGAHITLDAIPRVRADRNGDVATPALPTVS